MNDRKEYVAFDFEEWKKNNKIRSMVIGDKGCSIVKCQLDGVIIRKGALPMEFSVLIGPRFADIVIKERDTKPLTDLQWQFYQKSPASSGEA